MAAWADGQGARCEKRVYGLAAARSAAINPATGASASTPDEEIRPGGFAWPDGRPRAADRAASVHHGNAGESRRGGHRLTSRVQLRRPPAPRSLGSVGAPSRRRCQAPSGPHCGPR